MLQSEQENLRREYYSTITKQVHLIPSIEFRKFSEKQYRILLLIKLFKTFMSFMQFQSDQFDASDPMKSTSGHSPLAKKTSRRLNKLQPDEENIT